MTTLRTLAWLLFLPHFAFTVYLSTNPQWGLLDADLIGGINFGLWLLFAYTHHASVAATKWEVPTMFALQAIVLWVTVYIDSVLKMELFFGNHTYHEKTQYAGWIGGVPVYAVLAMFPMCYASLAITDLLFPPTKSYPFLMHLFLPILDNLIFTGWDMVIDPVATFESLYRWEAVQPFPGGDNPRSSRNMDMEKSWFGVPYGNYWSGWLLCLLPIFLGTRWVRSRALANGGAQKQTEAKKGIYELLPLISYFVNYIWCASIAIFGKPNNPGLALVGVWSMAMPCLLGLMGYLVNGIGPGALDSKGRGGKAE